MKRQDGQPSEGRHGSSSKRKADAVRRRDERRLQRAEQRAERREGFVYCTHSLAPSGTCSYCGEAVVTDGSAA